MRHFVRHFPAVAGVRWGLSGPGGVAPEHVAAVALADALEADVVARLVRAPAELRERLLLAEAEARALRVTVDELVARTVAPTDRWRP